MISRHLLALEDQLWLLFLFLGVKLWKVDFETIFDVLSWLFRNSRIASIMLLLSASSNLFAFSTILVFVVTPRGYSPCVTIDAHLSEITNDVPRMLGCQLLTLRRHFYRIYFRPASSLWIEKQRFRRNRHWNWAIYLFEEVVHNCSWGFARFFPTRVLRVYFFAICLTLHIFLYRTNWSNMKVIQFTPSLTSILSFWPQNIPIWSPFPRTSTLSPRFEHIFFEFAKLLVSVLPNRVTKSFKEKSKVKS